VGFSIPSPLTSIPRSIPKSLQILSAKKRKIKIIKNKSAKKRKKSANLVRKKKAKRKNPQIFVRKKSRAKIRGNYSKENPPLSHVKTQNSLKVACQYSTY